jgi:hypothetical protein
LITGLSANARTCRPALRGKTTYWKDTEKAQEIVTDKDVMRFCDFYYYQPKSSTPPKTTSASLRTIHVKQPENADLDYAKKLLEEIEKKSNSLVKKPKKELEFEINLSIIDNKVPAEEPNL